MAVTQISRIQVRRGRKNSPTGIPQLASGEIAWAVDSQELFIGNGSVAEGAPYVGNTKILTEHDNILSLVSSYRFGGEDPSISGSVARSIQSKLDESVSVLDFGAIGDGTTDNTLAFELAFAQLFSNTNPKYRKTLLVPNGNYVFLDDLLIPSYVELVGETKNGSSLNLDGNSIVFVPKDEEANPENITIGNLTITNGATTISGSQNVMFENVNFIGDYVLAEPEPFPAELFSAVRWENNQIGTETTHIKFKSCSFKDVPVGISCEQTIVSETRISFIDCEFNSLDTAVLVMGIENQMNTWKFNECEFKNTANHAIYISNGIGTLIRECSFEKCGIELDGTMSVPMVYFGQSQNNLLLECVSDRQQFSGIGDINEFSSYITEAYGADKASFITRNRADIQPTASYQPLAVFSSFNQYMEINYFLKLESGDSRLGKFKITIDKDNNQVSLTDDYTFTSQPGTAIGYIENTGSGVNVMWVREAIDPIFGIPFVGSVISGNNVARGTRISAIGTGDVNPTTGIGIYYVDRNPLLNPTSLPPLYQTLTFTRDSIINVQFNARLLNNISDDSSILDTLILEYRQEFPERGAPGEISFDVTYGTSV